MLSITAAHLYLKSIPARELLSTGYHLTVDSCYDILPLFPREFPPVVTSYRVCVYSIYDRNGVDAVQSPPAFIAAFFEETARRVEKKIYHRRAVTHRFLLYSYSYTRELIKKKKKKT